MSRSASRSATTISTSSVRPPIRSSTATTPGDYIAAQWYEGDPNIRRAVDFLTSPQMLAAGHEENLKRLQNELIHKDWFQTLPDFNAYVVRKGQALSDYACDPMGWRRKKCLYQHCESWLLLQRPHHCGVRPRHLASGQITPNLLREHRFSGDAS